MINSSINPSIGPGPASGVSSALITTTGLPQRDWFGDLDKGSQLPIAAPVSPNMTNRMSIIERADLIISHLESH